MNKTKKNPVLANAIPKEVRPQLHFVYETQGGSLVVNKEEPVI